MSDDLPGRGHNNPPEPTAPEPLYDTSTLRVELEAAWAHKVKRREELLASFARFDALTSGGIPDELTRAKSAELYRQLNGEKTLVDSLRLQTSLPFREAQKIVNSFFDTIADPLDERARTVTRRMTTYDLEKKRKADEAALEEQRKAQEAQRLAAEQAAAAAAQQAQKTDDPADLDAAIEAEQRALDAAAVEPVQQASTADVTRVKTESGVTSSLGGRWIVEIENADLIPRQYLVPSMPLIEAAMKASRVRTGPPTAKIPGVKFVQQYQTRTR